MLKNGPPTNALEHWPEIERRIGRKTPAIFLDYDGTLTPIVSRPGEAKLAPERRDLLAKVAKRFPLAILSGRRRADLPTLTGLDDLIVAGSHGFDIGGPGRNGIRHQPAQDFVPLLERAAAQLRERFNDIEGVFIEDKVYSIAVHYRLADEAQVPVIRAALEEIVAREPRLRITTGKKVLELRPDIDWHKGHALLWLLDAFGARDSLVPIFIGDDVTDEDALRAVRQRGIGIVILDEDRPTAARYALESDAQVYAFLTQLLGLPAGR